MAWHGIQAMDGIWERAPGSRLGAAAQLARPSNDTLSQPGRRRAGEVPVRQVVFSMSCSPLRPNSTHSMDGRMSGRGGWMEDGLGGWSPWAARPHET